MFGRWTRLSLILVAGFCVGNSGCSTMSNTEKGVGLGGALGAGVGTLVGHATGDPTTGAVVGGLMGAGVGGIVGADADQQAAERADIRRVEAEVAAQQARGPLSLDDVIQMSQVNPQTGTKVSDVVLVDYIRTSNSRFDLTPADIRFLADHGVSDAVVREMMNTRARPVSVSPPRTVVVREPAPTIIYERPFWGPMYCPPPPPFGFGFHYVKVRR